MYSSCSTTVSGKPKGSDATRAILYIVVLDIASRLKANNFQQVVLHLSEFTNTSNKSCRLPIDFSLGLGLGHPAAPRQTPGGRLRAGVLQPHGSMRRTMN